MGFSPIKLLRYGAARSTWAMLTAVLLFLLGELGTSRAALLAKSAADKGSVKDAGNLGAAASDIITITNDNFKKTLKQGTWFVKFYTGWCSHCKKLQPTWEELATELKGQGVRVGQVNCDRERALCRRFHVRGYPTLVHIHNKKCRVYQKTRSLDPLTKFAVSGYKKTAAISALKSPFGPIEDTKSAIAEASWAAKDFVVEQVEAGTPIWALCLTAVAMLVVLTVIVALVLVAAKRPKQD